MSRCTPGANEADNPRALGEVDQEEAAPRRVAHDDFSALPVGMEWIVVDPRQRIAEYGESFLERYAVLPGVRGGLRWVPRESRDHQGQAYHPPVLARISVGLTLRITSGGR